jgi:hypothetical protein
MSEKTDRKNTLTGYGELQNTFNYGLDQSKSLAGTGAATTAKGTDALGTSLDYFKSLMSGDRAKVAQAIAPQSNDALSTADAARDQRAELGTARGGGAAGANQTAEDKTNATIYNFLFGARPAAAQQTADIGGKLSSVGLGEQNAALGFGNLAEKSADDLTGQSAESRKTLGVPSSLVPLIRSVRWATSRANSARNASSARRTASSNRAETRACSCS